MSNLRAMGHMQARMAVNVAQHKNFLNCFSTLVSRTPLSLLDEECGLEPKQGWNPPRATHSMKD